MLDYIIASSGFFLLSGIGHLLSVIIVSFVLFCKKHAAASYNTYAQTGRSATSLRKKLNCCT